METETPKEDKEQNLFVVTIQTVWFQVIMIFATLYFGMLFSDWGDAQTMVEVDHSQPYYVDD